jgi:hypothetical protein
VHDDSRQGWAFRSGVAEKQQSRKAQVVRSAQVKIGKGLAPGAQTPFIGCGQNHLPLFGSTAVFWFHIKPQRFYIRIGITPRSRRDMSFQRPKVFNLRAVSQQFT